MTAFSTANILLPRLSNEDMTKWAAVACDQYTGEPDYWKSADEIADGSPSTLHLILPEVYLTDGNVDERVEKINRTMTEYLDSGLFSQHDDCFILTKRTQADGRLRPGLIGVIDLEMYDYNRGSVSQVRATEATVPERIPPRVKIRLNAPLELPHIMILIDDPQKTVIEPLLSENLPKLYDFELMKNGGHLEGFEIKGAAADAVKSALDRLSDKETFNTRYGLNNEEVLLYAVGDGNHSLATAKACYEQKKQSGSPDADTARYALVEIVNLHCDALEFEAIHRVIYNTNFDKLYNEMADALGLTRNPSAQEFTLINGASETKFGITKPNSNLTVGSLQSFLDDFIKRNGGSIDYIHGEDVVRKICGGEGAVGFLLPAMKKSELFPTVVKDGALPRKTFSMGHAHDKRFYCEARKIISD